jgi:hypothetical protein
MNPAFERYIGIDYSGAATPTSSLKGLRVYEADRVTSPHEVQPPSSPHVLGPAWIRYLARPVHSANTSTLVAVSA